MLLEMSGQRALVKASWEVARKLDTTYLAIPTSVRKDRHGPLHKDDTWLLSQAISLYSEFILQDRDRLPRQKTNDGCRGK